MRTAAARLRRALAEAPAEQERAEILTELGRCEVAAMEFEAAEEHLTAAMTSSAELRTRAEAASMLGRCAVVSGGRSAPSALGALDALADEIAPVDGERALELRSETLMVATVVPTVRAGVIERVERFRDQARGHPQFEALARVYLAQLVFRGEPAATAVEEVKAALAVGLPPGAETTAAFLALLILRLGEQFEMATHALELALERARREGHTTRQGIIHGQRAAIALAQGSLHDAQVEAETGLLLVEHPHFTVMQLLGVAITVQIERGALEEAAELVRTGEALGIAEDQTYIDQFLIARGRLRIAQGRAREGIDDLLWCGERLEAVGVVWPSEWRAFAIPALVVVGEPERAAALAHAQLEIARRVGPPGALGMSLRTAAPAFGEAQRLAALEEAVAILERSQARLEFAHALADLGSELGRLGRRREGRDAHRRAIELAGECGAVALAERARNGLHAGPGRRARAELTGLGALTAAEWRACRQAAEGRTNREIAQALFVTEKTVERHLSSAYHKLGIRSRFQLQAALGQ